MPADSIDPVLISGAGIGGLAAALALSRVGRRVIVAERRAAWSEAGAGIQLSPNGVAVLERLGIAAHLEANAGRPREIVVREGRNARVLQRLPLGEWIAARHGRPYWQIHRRDLQAALVAKAEAEPLITLVKNFEATSFEINPGSLTLRDKKGETCEGSLLVGADGVFSRVRQQLFAPKAPVFGGRTAARTVIPIAKLAVGQDLVTSDATGVWLAPGAHIVHYPIRAGREIAVVVVRSEPWRAHGWSEPVAASVIEAAIEHVAPSLGRALGAGHDWRRWALFETEPLPAWSKGCVTVLGDAAHPTLPFLAQGGSLALEDAWTLAAALARISDRAAIPQALKAYESARRDRTRRVVAAARRNGQVFHLSGAAALARNMTMRLVPGERVMAGFDWVYGWSPEPA